MLLQPGKYHIYRVKLLQIHVLSCGYKFSSKLKGWGVFFVVFWNLCRCGGEHNVRKLAPNEAISIQNCFPFRPQRRPNIVIGGTTRRNHPRARTNKPWEAISDFWLAKPGREHNSDSFGSSQKLLLVRERRNSWWSRRQQLC